MDWEIGPGCRYALAIALAALVVLGLAVSRPEAGKFLSEYQTLIAALVAIGAALVAYDGATAATREARRKDEIVHEASVVTTCLLMTIELAEIRARAMAAAATLGSLDARDDVEVVGVNNLTYWLETETPALLSARDNIGAYRRDLRQPILQLWNAVVGSRAHAMVLKTNLELGIAEHPAIFTRGFSQVLEGEVIRDCERLDAVLRTRLTDSGVDLPAVLNRPIPTSFLNRTTPSSEDGG